MSVSPSFKERIHEKLFFIFSVLIVITLPISVRFNSFAIVLLAANWIIEGNWKVKGQMLIRNKYALLFSGLYLFHVVGLIYTDNLRQGFAELERKVAFVAFPVIFAATPYLDSAFVQKILKYFVLVCLAVAAFCVGNGLYHYISEGDSSYLFYHKLGAVINFNHAVYFSFYTGFSIFILLVSLKLQWELLPFSLKTLYGIAVVFLLVFLMLLSSKTIIATVFLLIMIFIGKVIYESRRIVLGMIALVLCLAASLVLVLKTPNIRERFEEVLVDEYQQANPLLLDDYLGYHFTGGAIRLAIWKMTVEIINENRAWILGTGTGDHQDLLTAIYIKKHVYPGDQALGSEGFLHYNTHNQLMQFFLMFGVVGIGYFIYILIFLFSKAVRQPSVFLFLLLLFTSFTLTESTLQVQKGIVFFLFFSSLLVNHPQVVSIFDFSERKRKNIIE